MRNRVYRKVRCRRTRGVKRRDEESRATTPLPNFTLKPVNRPNCSVRARVILLGACSIRALDDHADATRLDTFPTDLRLFLLRSTERDPGAGSHVHYSDFGPSTVVHFTTTKRNTDEIAR